MEQLENIKKELKRLASIKCRLNKQRGKKTYADDMQAILKQEAELKALRDAMFTPRKTSTTLTYDDIQELTIDEVQRAIKSIQSKKSNTKWLTEVEGDNDDYRHACRIESMLLERRNSLLPTTSNLREQLQDILSNTDTLTKEEIVAKLQSLIK